MEYPLVRVFRQVPAAVFIRLCSGCRYGTVQRNGHTPGRGTRLRTLGRCVWNCPKIPGQTGRQKENFRIPHSVQDVIPIRRIWPDGIFRTGNAYSRSYRLTDINYAIASKADKTSMLLDYSELLNALDSGACAKITINNRRVDRRQFEQE